MKLHRHMTSSEDEAGAEQSTSSRRRYAYDSNPRYVPRERPEKGSRRHPKQPKPRKYESFHYEPLPKKCGAIRLLKLVPSSLKNPHIECELILQRDPPLKYEALSWCWGSDTEKKDIHIRKDGQIYRKDVSPNLFAALKALRHTVKDRYLWIDAICIDQENLTEKNHQVEMMHNIYGTAERVCVWLGVESDTSQRALDFIKYEVLRLQNFDKLCNDKEAGTNWRALLELMQRPWFSRRWVVQEIALAKAAVIYCGQDKISWRKFAIAVELFVEVETATHRLSEVMRKNTKDRHVPGLFDHVSALGASLLVDATDRLFRDFRGEHRPTAAADDEEDSSDSDLYSDPGSDAASSGPAHSATQTGDASMTRTRELAISPKKSNMKPLLSLEYLVSSLTIFNTTVPHDTIYALLAISKDTTPVAARPANPRSSEYARAGLEVFTQRKKYNVDYKLPYVDVCKEFIEFAIQRSLQLDRSRALDVICRPWATEEKLLERRRREAAKKKKETQTIHNAQTKSQLGKQPAETQPPADDTIDRRDLALPSWVPQLSSAPYGMYQQAGIEGEKMSRKNADPLVGFPGSTQRNYAAAETKSVDTKALRFRKRSDLVDDTKQPGIGHGQADVSDSEEPGLAKGHYSMYVRGFELDRIQQVEHLARNGQIPKEWAEMAGWTDAKGPPPDAFWRTLVADRGRDGKNPPVYYSRACKESFTKGGYESGAVNTIDLINYERNSVVSQFCRRVQAVIWNRALVKTENGRLGLVGRDVEVGDMVCILYGLSVPVILRQNPRKSPKVFECEVQWELKFIVTTIEDSWLRYRARKKRHEWRKMQEMRQLLKQWMKRTQWLRYHGVASKQKNQVLKRVRETDSKEKAHAIYKEQVMMTVRQALDDFSTWKARIRTHAWVVTMLPTLEKARKGEAPNIRLDWKSGGIYRSHESKQDIQIEYQRFVEEAATQSEKKYYGHDDEEHESTAPPKLMDWWAFEYALKAGRRWKKIVAERKVNLAKKGSLEMALQRKAEKKDQFAEFEKLRKAEGKWLVQAGDKWEVWKDSGTPNSLVTEAVTEALTNLPFATRENGSFPSAGWAAVAESENPLDTFAGAPEQAHGTASDFATSSKDATRTHSPVLVATDKPSSFSSGNTTPGFNEARHYELDVSNIVQKKHSPGTIAFDSPRPLQSRFYSIVNDSNDEVPSADISPSNGENEKEVMKEDDGSSSFMRGATLVNGLGLDTAPQSKLEPRKILPFESTHHLEPTTIDVRRVSIDALVRGQKRSQTLNTPSSTYMNARALFDSGNGILKPTSETWARATNPGVKSLPPNSVGKKSISPEAAKCIELVAQNLRKRMGDDGWYSYQLLGECYIHGMMDGEAMLYQNNRGIPSKVFEIR